MDSYSIIIKPVLSEKSYSGFDKKKYTFVVKTDATKTQIRDAVEEIFKVTVDKVNTVNVRGKLKRQGRTQGYTAAYKKAIVTLTEESESIKFFDSLS